MSNLPIETLESYLFAEDKKSFLNTLVFGSEAHLYLSLLHSLHNSTDLSPEILEKINTYNHSHHNYNSRNLHIRSLLQKFDHPSSSQSDKETIISDLLSQYLKFTFSYSKPADITSSELHSDKKAIPNTLDQKTVLLESQISKLYKSSKGFSEFSKSVLSRVDTSQITKNLQVFESFLYAADPLDFENFPELIVEYMKKKKCHYNEFSELYSKLTIDQLNQLAKLEPGFLNESEFTQALFSREFPDPDSRDFEKTHTKQEKREFILKVYHAMQQYPQMEPMRNEVLYEVLKLDLELNTFDKELFVKYLEMVFTEDQKVPVNEMITQYLQHFFRTAKDTSDFVKYFKSPFLNEVFYTTKLMMGETPDVKNVLSPEKLKKLAESKELTILKYNKEFYKGNDPVKIDVQIKNIPSLMIKIFEFKSENYFLKTRTQLSGSINLDGLIAAEETNVTFPHPPIQKFTQTFTLDSLSQKKQGIFIVDFIGNGLSSRVLIRKGKLSFIEQQTSAGQLFTIVDEDAKICKEGRTGIWIKDHFYRADADGKILVPFNSPQTESAILVHNDLAELTDIILKEESFEFFCGYIYNNESFIMGNKAKILVQPRLFLNGAPANLELMKNCTATISLMNEDGIPSKFNYEKLKLSGLQETELEFPVPAKLRKIQIEVKGQIYLINKKDPNDFLSSYSIPIEFNNLANTFCDVYLRHSQEGYQVFVLGKTGEPKVNVNVTLIFKNKYIHQNITQTLQTDNEGKVVLGKLEEITSVTANLVPIGSISQASKTWYLNSVKNVNYPSKMRICEGDNIVLPLLHSQLNKHYFSFAEVLENGSVKKNLLNVLKIDGNRLVISGLKEGTYKLNLKDVENVIYITVLKGTYWTHNKNFLLANNVLNDIKSEINNIVITNVNVFPAKESGLADVSIEAFADDPKRTRFHVFGVQFLDTNMNRDVQNLDANLPGDKRRDVDLSLRKSQFLNNRSLGDEYCYVLDRKSQARFLGNTLEKPPVLLKKTFVRETQTAEEKLSKGADFKDEKEKASYCSEDEMDYKMSKNSKKMKRKMDQKEYEKRERGGPGSASSQKNSLNFLENACLLHANLKLDEKGTILLTDFPVQKYSSLHIIASNLTCNISQVIPLQSSKIPTKDLTQKARDSESVFSINRASTNLPNGEKLEIKDLTSTEIQIVDSLPKLFDIQKNLVLSRRSGQTGDYEQWQFLKTWEDLSYEDKLRKYDKFASHELNLFVYLKDRTFFDKVVLPFLQNKIEKTIVDYFFLGDKTVIQENAGVEIFNKLNSLEKVLVILGMKDIDEKQAKNLASSLENVNSLVKIDANEFNKYFDTVLTSKSKEEEVRKPKDGDRDRRRDLGVTASLTFSAARPETTTTTSKPTTFYGVEKEGRMLEKKAVGKKQMKKEMQQQMDSESDDEDDDYDKSWREGEDFEAEYLNRRSQILGGFKELEKTKEYSERHYYEKTGKTTWVDLNSFWVDLAKHIAQDGLKKPFLTQNIIFAHANNTELISVLAFISLPFQPKDHQQTMLEGRGMVIKAASDLIVFTKAVAEAESDLKGDILITQRFFDSQEKYVESEEEPGVQIEKDVDQYVIDKLYGSTVIVTNSSASAQQLQVLVEIPEGAIPVKTGDYTKNHNIHLPAFNTQTIEFFFYFPRTGKFRVNPPNASKRGKVVAVGKRFEIDVKKEKTYETLETLAAVLTKGSKEDVLNFARTKNIWNHKVFDFNAIYWLLTDKEFFFSFIEILRERKCFNEFTWQFGFYHKDPRTIKEYFTFNPHNLVSSELAHLESSILRVDKLKLLEYNPFVNQRVHLLASSKNRILNVQMKEQYTKFISYLVERKTLDTEHYLGLVYYLLLQDRVEDAIRFFGKVNREEVRKDHQLELQYDYFAAYLDFFMGYPQFSFAREICQKYLDYPVLSWRSLFIEVANQLAEFDGGEILEDEVTKDTEKRQNRENVEKEEVVTMEIRDSVLNITHQNVKEITLSFYKIDLEVLFSRNPFIAQNKDEFSYIQASTTHTLTVEKVGGLQKLEVEIPDRLKKFNLYVELRTESKTLSANYFSTSLKVQIMENYGQVKVLDNDDKPLLKTYVKCFAKTKSGEVSFYKDGYTDLRGRFDYATLNSNDISTIEKFAIFVMNDEFGSVIKEAKAPSKLTRVEPKLQVSQVYYQQFESKKKSK